MLLLLRNNDGGLTDVSSALASVFEAGKAIRATKAETVFDDFNRADGAIGANWSGQSFYTNVSIADNGVGSGTTRASRYTATVFSDNHFAQAKFRSLTSWGMVTVRGSASGSFYAAGRNSNDTGNPNYFIYRFDDASTRVQLLNTGQATQVGDVFRLTVRDSLLTLTVNGVDIGSVTDTIVKSGGGPGLTINSGNIATAVLDDFVGGDVGGLASRYESTGQVQVVAITPATDNFNRTNADPIDGSWVKAPGTSTNAKIISNEVGLSANPGFGIHIAYYNNTYSVWPSDQYSQVRVTDLVGIDDYLGPIVRCAGAGWSPYKNYYFAHIRGGFGASKTMTLGKYVDGTQTTISTSSTITIADNDIIRLEAKGSALTVYINGISVLTGTDSSLGAGYPGFMMKQNSADPSNPNLDDWEGGSLNPRLSPYEAEEGLAPSRISVHEAIQSINSSLITPFEALAILAQALASVYESLEGTSGTPVDNSAESPFESLQIVASAGAKAYEALGSITQDRSSIVEALQQITQSRASVIEALEGLSSSTNSNLESAGGLSSDRMSAFEWISSIERSLGTIQEALSVVSQDRASNLEAGIGIATSDASVWESNINLDTSTASNIEAAGSSANAMLSAYEAGLSLSSDAPSPLESLEVLQRLNQACFESITALASTSLSNQEAAGNLAGSYSSNYEAINSLLAQYITVYESQGSPGDIFASAVIPFEAKGLVEAGRSSFIESLGSASSDLIHAFEGGAAIVRSILTAYEASVAVNRSLGTPLESTTLLTVASQTSFEAAKALIRSFDSAMEALQVLDSTKASCQEAVGIVSNTGASAFEAGLVLSRTLAGVYEALAVLSELANTQIEASGYVSTAKIAAYEATKILQGTFNSPFEASVSLSTTTSSIQEALVRTARELNSNIEAIGLVNAVRSHPLEAVGHVSKIVGINYESLIKLLVSALSPYESRAAVGIALQILYGHIGQTSLYNEKKDTTHIHNKTRNPFYED
jgi:hypothetical protein